MKKHGLMLRFNVVDTPQQQERVSHFVFIVVRFDRVNRPTNENMSVRPTNENIRVRVCVYACDRHRA